MKVSNDFYFPGKEPDEKIIIALRRHIAAIATKISLFTIIGLIPPIAYFLTHDYLAWLDDGTSLGYLIIVLTISIFYLYIFLLIYHAWVDYYLDLWIVTNERIVAMEQKGLFHRVVSELRLNRIQDVSSETKGFFPTIFKYGTVHVQTASEEDKFYFSEIPRPEVVARQILELHEKYVGFDQESVGSDVAHQSSTGPNTHFPNRPHENKPF